MTVSLHDYLIEQGDLNWSAILAEWSWLLPPEFTLWLVNRFSDLFLVLPDGSVHMLEVGAGSLTRLADSREEFCAQMDEDDVAENRLLIPLVDNLVAQGVTLLPGQCYAFKIPPVLAGEYTVENVAPLSITDYLGAYASIHLQLRDVPDGAQVVLKLADKPGPDATHDATPSA